MWKNLYIIPQSIFPQRCIVLLWNIKLCMNLEEYMWKVEQFIYSSTFRFSTMFPQRCPRLLWNIEECMNVKCGQFLSFSSFHFSTMFPQQCSRFLWNIDECINVEEYMLNAEELIYSSTSHFSTMFPQLCSRLPGILKMYKTGRILWNVEEYCEIWNTIVECELKYSSTFHSTVVACEMWNVNCGTIYIFATLTCAVEHLWRVRDAWIKHQYPSTKPELWNIFPPKIRFSFVRIYTPATPLASSSLSLTSPTSSF